MSTYIKFTPLTGAHDETPLGYLLEVDEYRILLDCGWTTNFDVNTIRQLVRVVKKVDVILISHPDIYHLGALPYLVGRVGVNAVIIGTIPVNIMGQMFMYDAYQSKVDNEDFDVFNLDDVDEAFQERMVQLKYLQPYTLATKGVEIEFTAYNAGHMLGGSIWKIEMLAEEIIYAVDYNHTKDKHLNPAVLGSLTKPTILITDSLNAQVNISQRKKRDKELLDSLKETLHNGGNVLLPSDTAGRVLELLVCLNTLWDYYKMTYPIYFLHHFTERTLSFAETHLEWCNDDILDQFHTNKDPFNLKNIQQVQSLNEILRNPNPKVVIASEESLNSGFALQLLLEWAPNPRNRIIFTSRPDPASLGRQLIENPDIGVIDIDVWKKIPLSGNELAEYQKELKSKQAAELALKKEDEMRIQQQREIQERYEYNEDDSGDATTSLLWNSYDLFPGFLKYEQERQFKGQTANGKAPLIMFPFRERVSIYDEYGEAIQAENFQVSMREEKEPLFDDFNDHMEVEDEVEDIPKKSICETITLPIHSLVQYIDFEGRADGRSIKNILSEVQPQQLILIHGSTEDTMHLAKACSEFQNPPKNIFTPQIGEMIQVTETTDVVKVKLSEQFFETSNLILADHDYKIAYVEAKIVDDEVTKSHPHLEVVPLSHRRGRQSIFIGDVKLRDFKSILQENGFNTKFVGGVLICNEVVALRRTYSDGKTTIEVSGSLSYDYSKVMELLYNRFLVF